MTSLQRIAVLASSVLVLSACGRQEAKTGASSADSHAPGTTLATAPGSCGSYVAGTPGVIRTFCGGPAVVKVSVGGHDHVLKGGTCETQGGLFALNLGVVSSAELGGPKPDYVGLTAPMVSGHFTNAVLAVNVDGKGYAVTANSGDVGPAGGAFAGTAFGGGAAVTGSFTC